MLIRKLTPDDAPAFREFRIEMCRLHPEAFGDTPEEVAAEPDDTVRLWVTPRDSFPENFILAAFDDTLPGEPRLLGTVAFRREGQCKARHIGLIWAVYVREEGRGRGVGKILMQAVIDECHRLDGMEILFLTVSTTQIAARTLYASLGFVSIGLFPRGIKLPDGRCVDDEHMLLTL